MYHAIPQVIEGHEENMGPMNIMVIGQGMHIEKASWGVKMAHTRIAIL